MEKNSKNRMLASLAAITVMFIALDALLKSWGIVADIGAPLDKGGHVSMGVWLLPLGLACAIVARIVAGCWSVPFNATLLASGAAAIANSSLWALVFLGLIFGTAVVRSAVRKLREDYGISRSWAIALLSDMLVSVYFGVSATGPMAKISWAIVGVAALVVQGIFENLCALDKQPTKSK